MILCNGSPGLHWVLSGNESGNESAGQEVQVGFLGGEDPQE